MIKKQYVSIALLLGCLLLTGCWDKREIETLGLVTLAGIDLSRDGLVEGTIQVAKPFAISGGSHQLIDEKPFWLVSSTGHTFFQTVRNLASQSPRPLFWAHNRILIIGEDYAREGTAEVFDLMLREKESRGSLYVLVAKGARAEDILGAIFELERRPDQALEGMIKGATIMKATSYVPRMLEMARTIETEGIEAVTGAVEIVPRPQPEEPERGQIREQVVTTSARLSGIAVFKGFRLAGYLNDRQSRGLLWVKGQVRSGIILVRDPMDNTKLVSLEIVGTNSTVTPVLVDGRPVIRVRIEAEGNLAETQGKADFLDNDKLWHSLERRMAAVIRNEIESALTAAQDELRSDIFGFGRSIYGSYPREWQEMRDNWDDDIFPVLEVRVEVTARLDRSGLELRRVESR